MNTHLGIVASLALACVSGSFQSHAQTNGLALPGVPSIDRKIAPNDIITVEVFGERDLTVERRVQASGRIIYPLLESVDVAGKTTAEIAAEIQTALGADYLVNPHVSVDVKDYAIRTVNVTGTVNKPGAYQLPAEQRWSIIDAITHAGGFTALAKNSRIEFYREGKRSVFSFDDLKTAKDQDKIWLQPGDLIHVPERFW